MGYVIEDNKLRYLITEFVLPNMHNNRKCTIAIKKGSYDDINIPILKKDSIFRVIKLAGDYGISSELIDKSNENYELKFYYR